MISDSRLTPPVLLDARKLVLKARNVHPPSAKADTFGLQAEALLECGASPQFDLSTEAEDAVPRQSERPAQRSGDLTRSSR